MIRVNLLPFRAARQKENIRKQISIYVLSVAFLFAAIGFFFIDRSRTLAARTETRAAKVKELDKYKGATEELKKLKRQIEETQAKLKVIKELEKNKTGPVRLLDQVAMAVPKDKLWLNSLGEKGGVLALTGTAMDNDTVALFMTNLEKSDMVSSVDLKATKLKKHAKVKLNTVTFSLTCRVYSKKEKQEGKAQNSATKSRKKRR